MVGPSADTGVIDHLTEELVRRRVEAWPVAVPPKTSVQDVVDAAAILPGSDEDQPVVGIVVVPCDEELLASSPIDADDAWASRCEGLLQLGLHVVQAAHELLAGGGRLIFVLPDVGITGAADHVPLATAVEGLRALAKSAGRQWADRGITTAAVLTSSDPDEVDVDAVADVVVALLGPAGEALTGVTLPVGTTLMVP